MRRLPLFPLLLGVFFSLALLPAQAALARQATTPPPVAEVVPYVPDPTACTVEPMDREVLLDLWFPPEGTPQLANAIDAVETSVTLPVGPAADEATVTGVTATLHSFYDCVAAADFTRYLTYFTDDMVQRFGPDPFPTRACVIGFLDAYPDPTPSTDPTRIVAITNVMALGEARAAALVTDAGRAGIFTIYVILVQADDGRWFVDEIYQFPTC